MYQAIGLSWEPRVGCVAGSAEGLTCWGRDFGGLPEGSYVELEGGNGFMCGRQIDLTIDCWGDVTVAKPENLAAPDGEFLSFDCGFNTCCALDGTGIATCWGTDATIIDGVADGNYSRVAVGNENDIACAVDFDGTIRCWGGAGAAGPAVFDSAIDVVDVALMGDACLLKTNGEVFCEDESPNAALRFSDIAAGQDFSCGILADGKLTCWGTGADATLLNPPDGNFDHLATGQSCACALDTTGAPQCWGPSGDVNGVCGFEP